MLYPMFAMVILTFSVGFVAVKARINSVKSGQIKRKYFALMQGPDLPEGVIKSTRNFNNQFETPVLFYIAATLFISFGIESVLGYVIAWAYVALRYLHAYIHLTYNNVLHRMKVFWLSLICILALWILLLIQV